MRKHDVGEITPPGGNIFEDIGFDFGEALNLKHRAFLAIKLIEWIDENGLKQGEAADRLGVNRPEISDLKRGRIEKFSIDKLVVMLGKAGKSVQMVVEGSRAAKTTSKSEVTGKRAASAASKVLRSSRSSKAAKSAAGSTLSQTRASRKLTSTKAGTAASKTLRNAGSSKSSKTTTGSALTQRRSKRK